MAAELEVRLSADTKQLRKELDGAAAAVEQYGKKIEAQRNTLEGLAVKNLKLEQGLERLNKLYAAGKISADRFQISTLSLTQSQARLQQQQTTGRKALSDYNRSLNDLGGSTTGGGLRGVGKDAKNVTPTLLEFNRVIQDAPFGIQGVANNIQQLTANFGQLTKDAGGTVPALKALAAGFIGPQGILFGVSVVTSLLVTYGDRLFRATGLTKELTDATKEFAGSAKAELSTLQALLAIAGDEAQSRERRNDAVAVLQDKYPDYLKNLTTENTTTEAIKKSVNELSAAIENRAKVQGAQNLITKKAEELFIEQTKAQAQYQKIIDELPQTLQRAQQANQAYARGLGASSNQIFDIQKNEERQRDIANQRLSEDLSEAEAEYKKYVDQLATILATSPSLLSDFNVKTVNEVRDTAKALEATPIYTPEQLATIFGITPEAEEKLGAAAARLAETVNKSLQGAAQPVKAYMAENEKILNEFNQNANSIIQRGIANTFADFGQVIGEGLVEGGVTMNRVGSALLGGFGSILIQLGELAIQTGVSMLAVFQALKTLNPWVAIAAGVALVAIGSAFSSGARQLAPSTGGSGGGAFGGASSNTIAGQGAQQGTASNSNSFGVSGSSGGTVVFEIQGQKLIGVLNNTLRGNSRLGGNLALG